MKVRPLHFVSDVEEAVRFYEALGLEPAFRWTSRTASCTRDRTIS